MQIILIKGRVPTAHDIVSARNLNTRIAELEKTNVNLRRMLELVKNDPSRNIDRISGTAPRLLIHRAAVSNSLGLPTYFLNLIFFKENCIF